MPAANPSTFADRLRALRAERGHTQQSLADATGLTRQYLARLETGTREPSWEVVLRLARAMEVATDTFAPG
jgi:transcriptional regulator with XRE-family HTH domain